MDFDIRNPGAGIDEVEVEWCVHCGKEGERISMQLREVRGLLTTRKSQGESDGQERMGREQEGMWWVCKNCCHGP